VVQTVTGFYCDENIVYFSEQKENSKVKLNKEIEVKNKSRANSYNSDEKKGNVVHLRIT
jgi:hypothetical protein